MKQFRISGKALGELALSPFCPRCFWIKRHVKKLPYQIFPGVFSTIDSYTKKVTHTYYKCHNKLLSWFEQEGLTGQPIPPPTHHKFNIIDQETDILLTGSPDDMFHLSDGSYAIIDYKTAMFTDNQDKMLPLYDVQLNAYAYIAERLEYNPVSRLMLLYYEPRSDLNIESIDTMMRDDGFLMAFSRHMHHVKIKPDTIPPLLRKARKIYDMPKPPKGREGCKDCAAIEQMMRQLI